MTSWLKLQAALAHKNRPLYIALRALRQKWWRLPLVGSLAYPVPEIKQIRQIINRSAPGTLQSPQPGKRILFFDFRGGWSTNLAQDLVLAEGLRLRGARPVFATCSAYLPICDLANRRVAPPMPCDFCATYVGKMVEPLQFPLIRLNTFIPSEERRQVEREVAGLPLAALDHYEYRKVPVGALVRISVARFLLRSRVDQSPFAESVWRRFVISGTLVTAALQRLLDQDRPDLIWTMNGTFFSEGILQHLAEERGIPFLDYEAGYRANAILVARNQIAGYYEMDSHWATETNRPLTPGEAEELEAYLRQRRTGKDIFIASMYPSMQTSMPAIRQQLGLDSQKPLVLMLTNVIWDSSVVNRDTIFGHVSQWLETTLEHFIRCPEIQLVVRIHPGEASTALNETEEPVGGLIRERFPVLPPHIKIVEPTDDISSYTLMEMAQYGVTYASLSGLEMTLAGKPVIVAGKTHYAGKGFTYTPASIAEYQDWLAHLDCLAPPSPQQIELARRYAFMLFCRASHPYPFATTLSQSRIRFNFSRLEDLAPGQNAALDYLCDKILNETADGQFLTERAA
jgi:hypothetical protein